MGNKTGVFCIDLKKIQFTINPFRSFCPPSCSEVIRDDFSRSLPLETCTRLNDVWQKCLQQKSSGSPNTHTHKQKSCAKFFPVTLLNFYGAFSRVELHLGDQKVGKKAGQLFSCFPSEKLQEENRSIFRQKRSWPNTLRKFTRSAFDVWFFELLVRVK